MTTGDEVMVEMVCATCGEAATTFPTLFGPPRQNQEGRRIFEALAMYRRCDTHPVTVPKAEAAPGAILVLDYTNYPRRATLLDGFGQTLAYGRNPVFIETFPGQGNSRGEHFEPEIDWAEVAKAQASERLMPEEKKPEK